MFLAILLLNLLTSQADKRTEFDDLGVIQKMLSLIELKLQNNICDEILENAWRIMRNVTGKKIYSNFKNEYFLYFL